LNSRKHHLRWLLALLAVLSLAAAACGGDDGEDEGSDDDTSEEDASGEMAEGDCPTDIEGEVIVSGSSTVEPISVAVGDMLEDCGSGVGATVDGPGTGDGFELFCNGETDISDASRPIAEDEVSTCEENGVEFIEIKVGVDGIAVMTNPANDAASCLSFADLYALIGPESEGFDSWSDAQAIAGELGSSTELPDADLEITAPGEESGTYDSFVELVIEDYADERGQEAVARPDYSAQADDNQIVAGIEGSDTSLGWVGFAFAVNEGDAIKTLAISAEPDGECIEPTEETIADNTYPISRDLFIYVNAASADENEAVAAYVDFYLSETGIAAVSDVGYVQLTEESLAESRTAWQDRTTGTRVS
jgi:phosphate transport system substrate-binding protein